MNLGGPRVCSAGPVARSGLRGSQPSSELATPGVPTTRRHTATRRISCRKGTVAAKPGDRAEAAHDESAGSFEEQTLRTSPSVERCVRWRRVGSRKHNATLPRRTEVQRDFGNLRKRAELQATSTQQARVTTRRSSTGASAAQLQGDQ